MEAIRKIPHRAQQYFSNWQVNSALVGAAVAITGCAFSIFSGAPFFAICFAFLTGISLFSAMRLKELGTLKAVADKLSMTDKNLNATISSLENQISTLKTELESSHYRSSQMALQIAAYEKTFEQNKVLLAEFHNAIKSDFGKETADFGRHNENLKQIAERVEKATNDLATKAAAFSDWLQKTHKTQFEELKNFFESFQIRKLEECYSLNEKANQLKGMVEQLENHRKEMEGNIAHLHSEVDRFTEQNNQLNKTTDWFQGNFCRAKENPFPINS